MSVKEIPPAFVFYAGLTAIRDEDLEEIALVVGRMGLDDISRIRTRFAAVTKMLDARERMVR